ncbi:hypothetical protein GIB67_010470 [Kingdonia uniflora]|uniref:Aladin n=1 Tax=Kingdonia uniflora TaxID=39325 RepID=A0A7J7MAG9_9MAGN|nr:hypothetical protein GIB67_010470 [Kingdonia uniflora]
MTFFHTYLASASHESSSFIIWDVAQGLGTPIRRGLGGISIVRWSPLGDYFLAAKFDGSFYLWETNTWTSEPWSSSGGFVTGATWDPDGRMVLVAFSESVILGSIHFSSRPPSLDAHLLPVDLPELASLTGCRGVEKIAWDASGERLAVYCKGGDEIYSGLIAIYDVRRTPLIFASLIGFIRGPGESPKPLAFSFHDKFKQGALLSVSISFSMKTKVLLQKSRTLNTKVCGLKNERAADFNVTEGDTINWNLHLTRDAYDQDHNSGNIISVLFAITETDCNGCDHERYVFLSRDNLRLGR